MMLLVLAGAVATCAAGCQPRNEFVPPPPPGVTVAVPLERPVQEYFETTGQTATSQRVELRARVEGYLLQTDFKDGELVESGRLLFVIDKAPYEAALASAQATLARTQAELVLADQELGRAQSLAERQAATQSALDLAEAKQASAAANVAAAKAAVRDAELKVQYTEIRAPFAGRVSEANIDVGNLVRPGETLLATLEAVSPMYAYFTLSETDLLRFLRMQEAGELKISDADPIQIELAIGDSGAFNFQGRLDYREFGIDPTTGTTRRRAVFENPDARLIPGLFVRLRARVGEPKPRLLVEERAIGSDQRGDYLLVVNDRNIVEYRKVQLGNLDGTLRVIEGGLQAGERVIINGLQRARPGGEVNPEVVEMGSVTAQAILEAEQRSNGGTTAANPPQPGSEPTTAEPASTEADPTGPGPGEPGRTEPAAATTTPPTAPPTTATPQPASPQPASPQPASPQPASSQPTSPETTTVTSDAASGDRSREGNAVKEQSGEP